MSNLINVKDFPRLAGSFGIIPEPMEKTIQRINVWLIKTSVEVINIETVVHDSMLRVWYRETATLTQ